MLSALRFGSSPRSVSLPQLASTGDFIFMFPCFGSFTGDFHPIYNAPMLGEHKAVHLTPTRVTPDARRFAAASVAPRASVGDLGRWAQNECPM